MKFTMHLTACLKVTSGGARRKVEDVKMFHSNPLGKAKRRFRLVTSPTQSPELTCIVSPMPNYNYLFQLPDENQKHIRHCIKLVSYRLRGAEGRLHAYASENADTDSVMKAGVMKTIEDLKLAIAFTEGMLRELVQAHGLPDKLGVVPDEYRVDLKDLLTNNP